MRRPAADEYWLRLEDRAELLESARYRYRALLEGLRAKAWEERLRKSMALLREAIDAQARVDEALAAVLRRAQAERWPAASPAIQLPRDVQALREKLAQAAAARLIRSPKEPLPELLMEVEERALTVPRTVPPEQRWAVALELLPEQWPTLRELSSFGALLAALFARPFEPGARTPFQPGEVAALRAQWSTGEVALTRAWSRLSGVDRTGGLSAELRKRAERALLHPPRNGPEHLVYAEYWRSVARKWLEQLVRSRIGPVEPTQAECINVAWWLCQREGEPEARLPALEVASEARAGLIELAHELGVLLDPADTEEPPHLPDAQWGRLRERARRADLQPLGRDAERVRDVLRTFIWKRAMGKATMRGWMELSASLEALVEQAWRVDM